MLLSMLFPRKCILCGALLQPEETDLCRNCRMDAPEYTKPKEKRQFLDSFTAVWYYEGNVRSSILRYKFCHARSYAVGYGRILAMKLQQEYPEGVDLITWVPISSRRKFRRGYDQGQLLAKAVSRELGWSNACLLKKIRHNRQQSSLKDAAQRRANVLGAYRVIRPEQVRGKRILLLDDVLTTGATAGECGRMLLTAGAKEVHCAALGTVRRDS